MPGMRRRFRFTKMSAGGNDFVVLDNREKRLPRDISALALRICSRKFSIGADGILVLENSSTSNFRMKYFNADGSHASMCGNGARCMASFAYRIGAAPHTMRFDTDAGIYGARVEENIVKIFMRPPQAIRMNVRIRLKGKTVTLHAIDTGVPHAVIFVKNIDTADVEGTGRQIRHHRQFKPAGTNVDFVALSNRHTIVVRTYERGVEGETAACGTGATASALIARLLKKTVSPVRCLTRGGGELIVSFNLYGVKGAFQFEDVCLEGPVDLTYKGEIDV